ncbi:MAG: hypothetical protein PHI05_04975 [Bacilli bacterium]|nr:hypothetical protein [Bacilli bacterium]
MNQALFFRKCYNHVEHQKNRTFLPEYGQTLTYEIIETINLSLKEYKVFINNFLKENKYIETYKNDLVMNQNDKVNCLLFTEDNNEGYLVYSSGYKYARYVAYWTNDKKND